MSVLIQVIRRAMVLTSRIKQVLKSSVVNPTWGLMILVAAWSADVISALRTVDHHFSLNMLARCVLMGAPCCHRCATQHRMDATAHVWG